MITRHQIGSWCRALTPTLSYADFKGTCGRVALIGGSSDGGSAATLATAAALRCGADLVYIMCRPEAKPFIDGLSVRPLFTEASIAKCREVVRMCDVLCVSDGLFGEPAADIESERLLGVVLGDAAFHRIPTVLGAATGNVVAVQQMLSELQGAADAVRMTPESWFTCAVDMDTAALRNLPLVHSNLVIHELAGDTTPLQQCVRLSGLDTAQNAALDLKRDLHIGSSGAQVCWRTGMMWLLHGVSGSLAAWAGAARRRSDRPLLGSEQLASPHCISAVAVAVVLEALAAAQTQRDTAHQVSRPLGRLQPRLDAVEGSQRWPYSVLPSDVIDHIHTGLQRVLRYGL
jgi:hypothetical protein